MFCQFGKSNHYFQQLCVFRTLSSEVKSSRFLAPGLLGIIFSVNFLINGGILLGKNHDWEVAINNNFNILIKAAFVNSVAAEVCDFIILKLKHAMA